MYKLFMVILLEIKTSRRMADYIVKNLGFPHSYHVETTRIFGWIWGVLV
jgi:hypothetical protein